MQEQYLFSLLIAVSCVFVSPVHSQALNYSSTINAGNGLSRGDWGPIELCPTGSYAAQIELKYEPWGSADVTNGDSVKLYCFDDSYIFVGYVTSTEGSQGTWQGIRACPAGIYIVGYSMDVTEEQGTIGDDVGVVNVRMECSDGTVLDGLGAAAQAPKNKPSESQILQNGNHVPIRTLIHTLTDEDREMLRNNKNIDLRPQPSTWGSLATCPTGQRVCGLQTRVEPTSTVTDDAGLCDMWLFCCV